MPISACPLTHLVRQHAVDPQGREQQRHASEPYQQDHRRSPGVERSFDAFGHGEAVEELHLRVDVGKRAFDGCLHRGAVGRVHHGANCEPDSAVGILRVRQIVGADARIVSFDESSELDVGHDADDLQPLDLRARLHDVVGTVRKVHPPADRTGVRPEPLRQPFIDDDDTRRVGSVALREEPALLETYAQRFEIARRDVELRRRDDRLAGRRHVSFSDDDAAAAVPAERQKARRTSRLDAWKRANPLERATRVATRVRRHPDISSQAARRVPSRHARL